MAEALQRAGIIAQNEVPKPRLKKTCVILESGKIRSKREYTFKDDQRREDNEIKGNTASGLKSS